MERMRTGKQSKLTPEEKAIIKAEKEVEREKFEAKNMGKFMLLYPLSNKVKEALKDQNKEKVEDNGKSEVIPEVAFAPKECEVPLDSIITPPKPVRQATPVSKEAKTKPSKKKSLKEPEEEGDIYLKYLKKAATIWEDFTTGKKKVKEESSDAHKKPNIKKTKSVNTKSKVSEIPKVLTKAPAAKANPAAVSHSNSIKKKSKKMILTNENGGEEHRKIVITTKTQSNGDPGSAKEVCPVEEVKSTKVLSSTTAKDSKMKISDYNHVQATDRPYQAIGNISRIKTKTFVQRAKESLSDPEPKIKQKHHISIERRSQNVIRINKEADRKYQQKAAEGHLEKTAAGSDTTSTKDFRITHQNNHNQVFTGSAYNLKGVGNKGGSFKETNITAQQFYKHSPQGRENLSVSNEKKKMHSKKMTSKSRISNSSKLRSYKYNGVSSTFQEQQNHHNKGYLSKARDSKAKNTIRPTFSPNLPKHSGIKYENSQRDYSYSKEQNNRFANMGQIRYKQNQASFLNNQSTHYKIETSTGVVYESNLQPAVLKRYGQPLIIKKLTSPSTLKKNVMNAYSGYTKQKMAQQRAKDHSQPARAFYPNLRPAR